jgi:hypothetical protein
MERFGFSFDWRRAPAVVSFGLVPPLTYVEVDEEQLRVRFGPYLRLDASRSTVEAADLATGHSPVLLPVTTTRTPKHTALSLRTARGPIVRVRFSEPQQFRTPMGLPRLRPQPSLVVLNPVYPVHSLAMSVADGEGLLAALGFTAG